MELKYGTITFEKVQKFRSNRTFMELKFGSDRRAADRKPVLIAPLWNWNLSGRLKTKKIMLF